MNNPTVQITVEVMQLQWLPPLLNWENFQFGEVGIVTLIS